MSADIEELVALELAEVGVVPGRGAPVEGALLVAPDGAYLRSAENVLCAIHTGNAQWLEEPLGWRERLQWRRRTGRRDPSMPAM